MKRYRVSRDAESDLDDIRISEGNAVRSSQV